MATVKEVLERSELFKGLTGEELDKIAALARVEIFEEGSTLFTEGGIAEDIFIIEVGRVAMDMALSPSPGVGKPTTVETIGKGQSCGWSAIGGTPTYNLTARAMAPVRAVAIDGGHLYSLLKEDPYLGYRVMARLASLISARLRNIRATLRIFHR